MTAWSGLRGSADLVLPDRLVGLVMTNCRWEEVVAVGRRFADTRCRDVVFERCDFSDTNFDNAGLERVAFLECRLTGAEFADAVLRDVVIMDSVADYVAFRRSRCRGLWAHQTSMKEALFDGAHLQDCALLDTDLTATQFDNDVAIRGLALHGSRLDGITGTSAFRHGGVEIDPNQLIATGATILEDMGISVTPYPSPLDEHH